MSVKKTFLSTLSLRRATSYLCRYLEGLEISIHALLAESDHDPAALGDGQAISIHALLAESDMRGRVYVRGSIISIHALLAESDWSRRVPGGRRRHFYPRSPCGERLFEYIQAGTGILFLSTLSLRRATFCAKCRCWVLSNISIHALLAESDIHAQNLCICVIHFYPRSPCGERLHTWQKVNPNPKIFLSTLSLRRATVEFKLYFINQEFLSTLSLRRATRRASRQQPAGEISIHALLAESDRINRNIANSQS